MRAIAAALRFYSLSIEGRGEERGALVDAHTGNTNYLSFIESSHAGDHRLRRGAAARRLPVSRRW